MTPNGTIAVKGFIIGEYELWQDELGYPIEEEKVYSDGTKSQRFQHGIIRSWPDGKTETEFDRPTTHVVQPQPTPKLTPQPQPTQQPRTFDLPLSLPENMVWEGAQYLQGFFYTNGQTYKLMKVKNINTGLVPCNLVFPNQYVLKAGSEATPKQLGLPEYIRDFMFQAIPTGNQYGLGPIYIELQYYEN